MAISRRPDYVTDDILVHDELNRWSINGSPQYLTQTVMTGAVTAPFFGVFELYPVTTYSHFKVIISKVTTSVPALSLNMKLAQNASVWGVNNLQENQQEVAYTGGILYFTNPASFVWTMIRSTNTVNASSLIVDIFNPVDADIAASFSKISNSSAVYSTSSGRIGNTNQYNGFELSLSAAGTMSGVVTVYALRNGSA